MSRSSAQRNIESLILIAHRLEELCEEVTFVGGCIMGLLITDKAAPDVRFTVDVDCIVDVITRPGYHALGERLRAKGFKEIPFGNHPMCRWDCDGILLDVMPTDKSTLGFSNKWYKDAFVNATHVKIAATDAEAILMTGDIAEAPNVCKVLTECGLHTNKPIYFVLGNHDYYSGSVANVREKILTLCAQNSQLIWLGRPAIINLNEHTVLVGHDGWADARYGDFDHSFVGLNDSRLITELFQAFLLNKSALKRQMQALADADAQVLEQTLVKAVSSNLQKVIIATHVPPFPECSWHKDKPSDDNWLPYFASKATGGVVSAIAQKHPQINFLVLCGHTHTSKVFKPFANLEVKAGGAEYYRPELQEILAV